MGFLFIMPRERAWEVMRKLILVLLAMVMLSGCGNMKWHQKYQTGYFDKDGKPAGYSGERKCLKQAKKDTGNSWLQYCENDPKCTELMEACMKENGYTEAKTFETTEERMALYRKAYEEGWIKPGMSRLEVINLLGAPQIATYQLIPPRKIWMYCRSATKTAFLGYNFVLLITWNEDKVESVDRKFKI